uniref:Thioredoxin domain-containing protein n=2 Tax=Sciurus vulgaris TaxID=55149 RepID=A0A8D2CRC4_SCIVU
MASSRGLLVSLTVLVLLLLGLLWPYRQWRDVHVIMEENWRELLEGGRMIEFYALFCPACQNLQPEWGSFAEWGDLEINVAIVDVAEQTGIVSLDDFVSLPITLKFILF